MKLLFAYDVVFVKEKNSPLYYSDYFNYSVWQRYLNVFSKVTICSRVREMLENDVISIDKLVKGSQVFVQSIPDINNPISMFTNRPEAKRLLTIALQQNDVLIARLPSEIGLLAIELAQKMGKPWAVEVVGHAWDTFINYGNWKGTIYAPIATLRMKHAVAQSAFALYVTDKFLQKHYPSKGVTIGGCSNVMIPMPSDQVFLERKEKIRDESQKYIIGLIGYLDVGYKGIDTAISAVEIIKKYIPNVELRILGGGGTERWLKLVAKRGVEEHVVFSGTRTSGQPVYDWLDELDLYIQPSRQEGLPRALIEAMSRALPAIGSSAGGIPELLQDSCIIKPGDYKKLAQYIIELQRSEELQTQLAEQNFNKVKKFTKTVLDEQRNNYLKRFVEYCNKKA